MNESIAKIPFSDVIAGLLDDDNPLNPSYLYRLTDIEGSELRDLEKAWPRISAQRRTALLEDLEIIGEGDTTLSFEAVARIAANDENPQVRFYALRILSEFEEEDLARIFLDALQSDPSSQVRAEAASGLGNFVYLGEIEEIDEDTSHEIVNSLLKVIAAEAEGTIQIRALESLGYSSRPEVPQLIATAYASGDPQWMASALYAMGRSGAQGWGRQVMAGLEHPHNQVRVEAVRAAGELELDQARQLLMEYAHESDLELRQAAIWSLSQMGGEGVYDLLTELGDEAEDGEEIEFLSSALDNLTFTNEMREMVLMDLEGIDEEDEDEEGLLDLDDEDSEE